MDSSMDRVRELLEMSLNRECTRFAREALIEAALRKIYALLTAEPEPCEDARAFAKSIYMDVCERVEKDGYVAAGFIETYAEEIAAYASQVADKRSEELRAHVETLREALGKYANPCNWAFADDNVERVWFEPDGSTPEAYPGYELAQKALAATEPKP